MQRVAEPGVVPLRKNLAKKLINYYDELKGRNVAERPASRSRSRGRGVEASPEPQAFQEDEFKQKQLDKVRRAMSRELHRDPSDSVLDSEDTELKKTLIFQSKHDDNKASVPIKEHIRERLEKDGLEVSEPSTNKAMFDVELEGDDKFKDKDGKKAFDHHLRKSKDIRRTQYAAELETKNREMLAKAKLARGSQITKSVNSNTGSDYDHLTRSDGTQRSDPKKRYAIWTIVNGVSVPSYISSPRGFALTEEGDKIEINEDDIVYVEPKNNSEFLPFSGKVALPDDKKVDCDFIVFSPSSLQKHPIQVEERARKRRLAKTNCTLLDAEGKQLGRAFVELTSSKSYTKAVELDGEGQTCVVLAKTDKPGRVSYRDFDEEKEIINNDRISRTTKYSTFGIAMAKVELEPKISKDDRDFPRELYTFGKPSQVENLPLFQDEIAKATCENGYLYRGPLRVERIEDQDEYQLSMLADKTNNVVPNASSQILRPHQSFGMSKTEVEQVFIDLDDKADLIEIDQAMEQLDKIAKLRSKRREAALRNKSSRGGGKPSRQRGIHNRSASPNTEQSSSHYPEVFSKEANDRDADDASSRKQAGSNKHQSAYHPRSPRDSKTTGPTRADDAVTTPFSAPTKKYATPTKNFFEDSPREDEDLDESRSKVDSNFKIKMDVANSEFNRIDMDGNVSVKFARSPSSMVGFDGLMLRKVKLSDQIKLIKDKALRDIQIYCKYKLNKPKFHSNNSEKLPSIRERFRTRGQYLVFVKYFLDLPSRITITQAFKSFSQVMDASSQSLN